MKDRSASFSGLGYRKRGRPPSDPGAPPLPPPAGGILWGTLSSAGANDALYYGPNSPIEIAAGKRQSLGIHGSQTMWLKSTAPAAAVPSPTDFNYWTVPVMTSPLQTDRVLCVTWWPGRAGRLKVSDPDGVGNNAAIMSLQAYTDYIRLQRDYFLQASAIRQAADPTNPNAGRIIIVGAAEMNGSITTSSGGWFPWSEGAGTPSSPANASGSFVAMWRFIVDRFAEVGANLQQGGPIEWVWPVNDGPDTTISGDSASTHTSLLYNDILPLWPGSSYVDWLGLSCYNKYATGTIDDTDFATPAQWMRVGYNVLLSMPGASNKPVMIEEFAARKREADKSGGSFVAGVGANYTTPISQAKSLYDQLGELADRTRYPNLGAIRYYNSHGTETPAEAFVYRISNTSQGVPSSPQLAQAFALGIADPLYLASA